MTTLFTENFETDLSQWKTRGTPTLQSAIVYSGAKALQCKPWDQVYKQFAPMNKIYVEAKLYYDLLPPPYVAPNGAEVQLLHFQGAAFADILMIYIYRDTATGPTRVAVWSPFGNSQFLTVDVPPHGWVKVGLEYTANVNGGWRAFINDVEIVNVTGVDTSSKPVEYVFVGKANYVGVNTYTDDVLIADEAPLPQTFTLNYRSTPISVPLTYAGQQLASGQSVEIPQGAQITVSVPAEVTV